MICPVCEHPQEFGLECEVCGKDLSHLAGLGGLGPPPTAVERVEGLEVTVGAPVGDVPLERVGDLEVTRYDEVAAVAVERVPDVDISTPIGEVPVEPMIDMSEDRAPDDGVRTVVPAGAVTCRYCRNVQAEGAICDRCGMKLARVAGAAATAAPRKKLPELVRCKSCGAPARPAERCSECGRLVPPEDA